MGYCLKDSYGALGFFFLGLGLGVLGFKYFLDYSYWMIAIGLIFLFSYYFIK